MSKEITKIISKNIRVDLTETERFIHYQNRKAVEEPDREDVILYDVTLDECDSCDEEIKTLNFEAIPVPQTESIVIPNPRPLQSVKKMGAD